MGKTHDAYPPEFRRQMIELTRSGRPPGPGSGVRALLTHQIIKIEPSNRFTQAVSVG